MKETGAPAALKAIEEHELKCRIEKDEARALWKDAVKCKVEGDDVSTRAERRTHNDYLEALEIWDDATKKLAVFDKNVRPERREGEKVPVAEAKEIYAQLELSWSLAVEQYILSQAQSAALCSSPEQFYTAHAENIRAAKCGALDTAKRDGVLPGWLL